MNSNIPFSRQVAWISIVPHLIVFATILWIFFLADQRDFLIYGAFTYTAISFGLRYLIAADHRAGIAKVHQGQFLDAVQHFEKSYEFFSRNLWIDKFRYLTMLTSSKMAYREMALCNIAFCYGRAGESEKALSWYNRVLAEFPRNRIAMAALNCSASPDKTQNSPAFDLRSN